MTCRQIAVEVAARRGVPRDELLGSSRRKAVVVARYEAMYRCRSELGCSYPEIGRAFRRDHSTVLYGVRQHRSLLRGLPAAPAEAALGNGNAKHIILEQAREIAELTRRVEWLEARLEQERLRARPASRQGELFAVVGA